jgi:hypothetical protein
MDKERKKKVIIYAVILLMIAIIVYFASRKLGIGIPCPSHTLFHVYCPGCGLTRMFLSLFEFNFYQAFRYNALWFVMLPFVIVLLIDGVLAYLYKRETKIYKRIPIFVWWILLAIVIAFGLIRNFEPFDYLAPTDIVEKK